MMLSGIWKWVAGAATLAATILYALLQKKRADHAFDKAKRAEAKAEKAHNVMQARDMAHKEAELNAARKRKEVHDRRAALDNSRMRDD